MTSKSSTEKTQPEKQVFEHVDLTISLMVVILAALTYYADAIGNALPGELSKYSAEKKYGSSFETFYPFYQSQHQNEVDQKLHVLASAFIILYVSYDLRVGISLGMGQLAGLVVKDLTRFLSIGIAEFVAMMGVYVWSMTHMKQPLRKTVAIPVVAYGLAWVGHFWFENNRPATFIYPAYSLLADFKAFFERVLNFYTTKF